MKIPEYGGLFAVDLESVERLMAARVTSCFEGGKRAVLEARQEGAGIVDAHFLHLAGEAVGAFLDESLRHGGDLIDMAIEPERCVDAVREQIARHAASGD